MAPPSAKPNAHSRQTAAEKARRGARDLPPPEPGRADLPVGLDAQQRVPTSVQGRGQGKGRIGFNAASKTDLHPTESRRAATRRSSRTRVGKIARLPGEVREELNRRLHDGEPGETLLAWLNALPKTKEVLRAQFGGRPLSKQNLSEWKQGGYRDWERAEEDRLRVDRLTRHAADLADSEHDTPLSERLAAALLVQLAGALDELRDQSLPLAERWQFLRQMLREVAQMRREDDRAAKRRIEQGRWEWESERLGREKDQREQKERKEKQSAPYEAVMKLQRMTEVFGGGKSGRAMAAQMLETQHDLAPGTLGSREPSKPVKPCRAKPCSRRGKRRGGPSDRSAEPAESSRKVRASHTEANQAAPGPQDAGAPSPAEPGQASGQLE